MGARIDIHNSDKRLRAWVDRVNNSDQICQKYKETINRFIDYCLASGLSTHRAVIYAERLYRIATLLKRDFKEANKEDIKS